jgi:hypothetical protein
MALFTNYAPAKIIFLGFLLQHNANFMKKETAQNRFWTGLFVAVTKMYATW